MVICNCSHYDLSNKAFNLRCAFFAHETETLLFITSNVLIYKSDFHLTSENTMQ